MAVRYVKWSRSVMSDYLQPHELLPARLLCPWDLPGKNIGVGCHFLLQGIFLTQRSNTGLLHCRQTPYWCIPGMQETTAVFFCTFYIRRTNLGSSKKCCHIYFLLFLSEKDFRKCSIAQKGKSKWRMCGTFQSTKISYPKFNHSCIMRVQHSPHVPLIAKFTTSIWENEGGLVHILENHPKYLMFLTVSCRNLSKRTIKEMDDWGLFSRFSAAFQKCWKQFCNCLLMNLCCFPLGNVSLKLSPCQLSMAWFIPVKDQR